MNPQPVSLADELRKFAEDLRSYKPMRSTAINETQHTIANKILALLDQHAAEQPKLTVAQLNLALMHARWDGPFDPQKAVDEINRLLTSPVAPPPPKSKPWDEAAIRTLAAQPSPQKKEEK